MQKRAVRIRAALFFTGILKPVALSLRGTIGLSCLIATSTSLNAIHRLAARAEHLERLSD